MMFNLDDEFGDLMEILKSDKKEITPRIRERIIEALESENFPKKPGPPKKDFFGRNEIIGASYQFLHGKGMKRNDALSKLAEVFGLEAETIGKIAGKHNPNRKI